MADLISANDKLSRPVPQPSGNARSGASASVAGLVHELAVPVAGMAAALVICGGDLRTSLLIAAYVLIISFVAGSPFSWIASFSRNPGIALAPLSVLAGISIIPSILYFLYVLDLLSWFNWLLLPMAAAGVAAFRSGPARSGTPAYRTYVPVVLATLLAPIGVVSVADDASAIYHSSVQAIIADNLDFAWPPQSPFAAGLPVAYHYGVHLLIKLISASLSIKVDELVDSAVPALVLWIGAWGITTLAMGWLRVSILSASLAAITLFCVVQGFTPFDLLNIVRTLPYAGALIYSPILGHVILVLSLFVLIRSLEAKGLLERITVSLLLVLLAFSASIVRSGAAGLLLACTSSAFWLYLTIRDRRIDPFATILVFLVGAWCIAGVVATLGLPGDFSGTGFLRVSVVDGLSFFGIYRRMPYLSLTDYLGISSLAAGLIGVTTYFVLAAGVLSPAFWVYVARWRLPKVDDGELILFLAFLIGSTIGFVTVAPGASHLGINHTAFCCSVVLGARALDQLWRNRSPWTAAPRRRIFEVGIWASIAVLLFFQLREAYVRAASRNIFEKILVDRQPELRSYMGEKFDLEPIISGIPSIREYYFMMPQHKSFHVRNVYNLIARHQLRLLTLGSFLEMTSLYGDEVVRMQEHRTVLEAYGKLMAAGTLDLGLARRVVETSRRPDAPVVVIGLKSMEVVEDPSFRSLGGSGELTGWIYTPNEVK